MANVTVNISFQDRLLDEIDAEARRQSRSRSELIREASRAYVRRQRRWDDVFALGDATASKKRLTQAAVSAELRAVRRRPKTGAR